MSEIKKKFWKRESEERYLERKRLFNILSGKRGGGAIYLFIL